jgi:hypothetical protein
MSNTLPPKGAKQLGKVGGSSSLLSLVSTVGMDFRPQETQREAKARFWAVIQATANYKEGDNYSWEEIIELIRVPAIKAWSELAGFSEWFFDKFETEQRVAVLFDKSLIAIEQIILNDDPKVQGARINAIKLLMDMRKSSKITKLLDEKVQEMNVDQLRSFVQANTVQRLPEGKDDE